MPENNGGFLGGGPQFNKVGASVTDDGTPEAVVPTQSIQPYHIRNLVIALIVLVMIGVLFFISDPGGIIHKGGHAAQPRQDMPAPPSNF